MKRPAARPSPTRPSSPMDVFVTGASRGIGRAIAERYARNGDRVLVGFLRNEEAAEQTCAAVRAAGGEAWSVSGDVRNPEALKAMVAEARSLFGGLDVLVHNAAIGSLKPADALRTSHWDLTIESSLRPFWLLTKLALPLLRDGGSVVGLSSLGSVRHTPGYAAMGAAKAGMEALTRQMAVEFGPRIRVNTVRGGLVRTDALRAFADGEALAAEVELQTPMGRLAAPQDLAEAVVFLSSPAARAITGQVLVVDGGFSAR